MSNFKPLPAGREERSARSTRGAICHAGSKLRPGTCGGKESERTCCKNKIVFIFIDSIVVVLYYYIVERDV